MKKIIVSLVVVLSAVCSVVNAQEVKLAQDSVKFSGKGEIGSQKNSLLTGNRFNKKPFASISLTASYEDFSFSVARCSDLLDETSGANFFAFTPSWGRSFGKYDISASLEFDFFDVQTQNNLVAPYIYITRNGGVNIEAMVTYGWCFKGGTLDSEMLAVSKSYQGYTVKGYIWNVTWGSNQQNSALEISKNLSDKIKLSVYGHLTDIFEKNGNMSYFGALRLGYSFNE